MNPDINKLRRDLGLSDSRRLRIPRSATGGTGLGPAEDPAPAGISMSRAGAWGLGLLGAALAVWILIDPICALLAFLWKAVCTIFQVGMVILLLSALGSLLGD